MTSLTSKVWEGNVQVPESRELGRYLAGYFQLSDFDVPGEAKDEVLVLMRRTYNSLMDLAGEEDAITVGTIMSNLHSRVLVVLATYLVSLRYLTVLASTELSILAHVCTDDEPMKPGIYIANGLVSRLDTDISAFVDAIKADIAEGVSL